MPTGVRMPVDSMSMRLLIGIVQALVMPGICSALVHLVDQLVVRDAVGPERPEQPLEPIAAPSASTSADLGATRTRA